MKICKFELTKEKMQLVQMPAISEIMDIQMENGKLVMFALVDTESQNIEVKINRYSTGCKINNKTTKNEYLATVQDGELISHFFMNYEAI